MHRELAELAVCNPEPVPERRARPLRECVRPTRTAHLVPRPAAAHGSGSRLPVPLSLPPCVLVFCDRWHPRALFLRVSTLTAEQWFGTSVLLTLSRGLPQRILIITMFDGNSFPSSAPSCRKRGGSTSGPGVVCTCTAAPDPFTYGGSERGAVRRDCPLALSGRDARAGAGSQRPPLSLPPPASSFWLAPGALRQAGWGWG